MCHDLKSEADELIRTLGALALAQESLPASSEVFELTQRAQELTDSLASIGHAG